MMTSRGRTQDDWDPMAEDFNDTLYDSQHQGDDSQMVTLDHTRLYITNIPKSLNDQGLHTALSKYGTLIECYISKDPLKKYGLASYETAGEAKLAMAKLNRAEPFKLSISIAHKKSKRDRPMNTTQRDRQYNREETSSVGSRSISNK